MIEEESGEDGAGEELAEGEPEEMTRGGTVVAKRAGGTKGATFEAPNIPSILESLRKIGSRGLEVTRFKGLGEMDASQLWETTMDPARRTLLQVTIEDAVEADRVFDMLMGTSVPERRRFIQTHARTVRNLDI